MNYIDINIVKEYFDFNQLIQLTDDSNSGDVNYDVLTDIINFINSYIDDNLRSVYSLPLKSNYPILKSIGLSLIKYELYKRRDAVTEAIKQQYDVAINELKRIRKKEIVLNEVEEKTNYFIYEKKKKLFDV